MGIGSGSGGKGSCVGSWKSKGCGQVGGRRVKGKVRNSLVNSAGLGMDSAVRLLLIYGCACVVLLFKRSGMGLVIDTLSCF